MTDSVVSRCRLCGTQLDNPFPDPGRTCIACQRKWTRPCVECQDVRPGKHPALKYEFQKHDWDGQGDCPRCRKLGRRHGAKFTVQRECPACHNERVIFDPPPPEEKT